MALMETKEIIYSTDTIDTVVNYLKSKMQDCCVFTFSGSLGAGKTTLVQNLLRSCGVTSYITSPTFTYVNVYNNNISQTFYHFDLYRIHSVEEFIDLGFYEYLYEPNSWSFIEWPEVIMPLLTQKVCHVSLDYYDNQRKAVIQS